MAEVEAKRASKSQVTEGGRALMGLKVHCLRASSHTASSASLIPPGCLQCSDEGGRFALGNSGNKIV